MEIGIEGLIIIIIIAAIVYFLYDYYENQGLTKVKSEVDNKEYIVQERVDAKEAANLIAKIKERLSLLVEHLSKTYGGDERVQMLKQNYRPDKLQEGKDTPGMTSYSINKGEKIVFCLRDKNKLMDINTMMFVALHEIAHLATKSIGHDEEFWKNFEFILEESINIGIYVRHDYAEDPVSYCGMEINSTPLD
jgi:predicted metal-dependent hydrolase